MKKSQLVRLHLYCGLFTSFYILAFGISSLILNHNWQIENKAVTKTLTKPVSIDQSLDNEKLAENIRDQLGLMGWLPKWQMQRDSQSFKFTTVYLSKTNQLNVDLKSGMATIGIIPKGFLATLNGLHFFNGKIPNAPFFLKTWIVYQWLSLAVLFISLVLGLWLWIKFNYHSSELYFFGLIFILSIILMFLI